jgi:hypothetical protein
MKIYKHSFHYQYQEYFGELNVYMTKKMGEEEFFELFNREYAGKRKDEEPDTLETTELWPDSKIGELKLAGEDEDGKIYHEIWPENGEEDYVDWRFSVTEINVIEGGDDVECKISE